ncbi:MAG: outer membrane protein [Acidobacteria bacterium OLB17]|nr:MAG: outer membrane protein [Acidobacteria bacterium OLB17]MCZ2391039.1 OmpH family outer membrane protein [Acidobacteriota bacterium]
MKSTVLAVAALLFAGIFTSQAAAQTPQAGGKIAFVDSQAFASDKGITKYINALKALDTEFAPKTKELTDIQTRLNQLAEDIKKMTSNPAVPVKPADIQAKRDEGERLARELDFKKKEAEATAQRRSEIVLGPIMQDIGRALQTYATSKGYTLVFDYDKIGQGILAYDPKADITAEFIAYYNTRPATAATAAAPK